MSDPKPFVIYLDIDGVLVSYLNLKDWNADRKQNFLPKAVETLNAMVTLFDADICLVSTWGRGKDPDEFKKFLLSRGIIVNGFTIGDIDDRAGYVLRQKALGWNRYLILDDEAYHYYMYMEEIGYNRILATNSWRGLDEFDLVGVSRNYDRLVSDYPASMPTGMEKKIKNT